MKNIKNRVKEYRSKFNYTQAELGKKAGVTRLTIISMEKQNYEPTVGLALRLAKIFGCTVEELFEVGEQD